LTEMPGVAPAAGNGTATVTAGAAAAAAANAGATAGPAAPVVSSRCRLVLIPSYNTGSRLLQTVQEALAFWQPVWVVIDGSTDGSARLLDPLLDPALPTYQPGLKVIELPVNRGKGGALLHAMAAALHEGYSHVLTMDADGQHPAERIAPFMAASEQQPAAMILGRPVFDADAPSLRVKGRRISNWWANLETFEAGIGDSLFGFRVYPIAPLLQIMMGRRWMRRFDFDPEAAVRLCWNGVKPVNLDAPVRYLSAAEGGVSHFNYYRDNLLLTGMHLRLVGGFLVRALLRRLRAR
jgi:glycosyltransferase involved in cell wall biosynthesis